MKNPGLLASLSGLAMITLMTAPVQAQDSDRPAVNEGIADIVVTAQKYEQNLQDTPLSIVAVGGDQLQSMGVDNMSGFDAFLPNVSIGGTMGQGNAMAAFSIRGIGGAPSGFVTQESAVGVYIDDVLFARPNGALLDLLDVERIEVLRGPQGTLFGRNTAGGAIRYVTKKPEFDGVSGFVKATAGSYARRDIAGALNIPFADNLAIRGTFAKKSRDGYIKRLIDGDKAGDTNTSSMRLQLRWQPTDRLDITLTGDSIHSHDDGSATITRGFSPTDLYVAAVYANNALGEQARRLVPSSVLPNLLNNLTTGGTYAGYSTAAADIAFYQNQLKNNYQVYGGVTPELNKLRSYGLGGIVSYELTDDITLKSLTGYRNIKQIQNQDFDRTPLPLYFLNEDIHIEYATQEVQLTGKSFGDRLQWVVGGFYYWDKAQDWRRRLGGSGASDSGFADDLSVISASSQGLGLGELERKFITTRSLAFFGQGTLSVTDELSLTAGVRWSRDEKDYSGFREGRGRVCVQSDGSWTAATGTSCTTGTLTSVEHNTSGHWTDVSPRFSIDYKWTPDVMTYVSASRGFKGGGFNDTLGSRCATGDVEVCGLTQFKPENLWTYEAGLRSDLFDRMIRFNLTAFLVKYKDLQIQYIDIVAGSPPIQRTLNGNSTVKGFEVEFMAAPAAGLLLRASAGYTDSQYDEDVLDPNGVLKIEKTVPYFRSPKWSYSLGATYTVPVGERDEISADVNWGWKAKQASTAIPTNLVMLPSYGLLNGRLEYRSGAGWSIAAFGTNLLDKFYYSNGFDPGGPSTKPSPGSTLAHDAVFGYSMLDVGRPRELGVELNYKF